MGKWILSNANWEGNGQNSSSSALRPTCYPAAKSGHRVAGHRSERGFAKYGRLPEESWITTQPVGGRLCSQEDQRGSIRAGLGRDAYSASGFGDLQTWRFGGSQMGLHEWRPKGIGAPPAGPQVAACNNSERHLSTRYAQTRATNSSVESTLRGPAGRYVNRGSGGIRQVRPTVA